MSVQFVDKSTSMIILLSIVSIFLERNCSSYINSFFPHMYVCLSADLFLTPFGLDYFSNEFD